MRVSRLAAFLIEEPRTFVVRINEKLCAFFCVDLRKDASIEANFHRIIRASFGGDDVAVYDGDSLYSAHRVFPW